MKQNKRKKNINKRRKNLRKKTLIIIGIILFLIVLIFIVFKPQNWFLKKIYKLEYNEYVYRYAKENEVDPYLIFSIIKAESNFARNIESSSGAIGLMQLMEATAIEMANEIGEEIVIKEALYNPEINIKIGTNYYAYLIKRYDGNKELALAAYNAGMGNVDSWIKEGIIKEDGSDLENIPFKETNNYVRKIVRNYRIYKNLYNY